MKITVFTPTYNRGYILENLYKSLQRQSYKDFEWLIIDDGSSDNTEILVSNWQKDNNIFPIRYYYKSNGGKHRAINYALDLAGGELFFTVDSDDYLTDDALEKVAYWDSTITNKKDYCGFMGQRGISSTETPNQRINLPYRDGNALERYREYCNDYIDGERADVWYTSVHRKFKYPEFENETFMTEAVTWNRMANEGYKIRYFDDIIWICEYLEDGLTKAGFDLFLKNPKGYILFRMEKTKFIYGNFRANLKCIYSIYCDLNTWYTTKEISKLIPHYKIIIDIFAIIFKIKNWKGKS